MKIFYNDKKLSNGEFLKVKDAQVEPEIKLTTNPNKVYTLILHDPDAVGGDKIHWFRANIKNNDVNSGSDILPYVGPAPPPNSGIHRYIFELYEKEIKNIPTINNIDIDNERRKLNKFKKELAIKKLVNKSKFISHNANDKKSRRTRKRKNTRGKTNGKSRKYH
jgi:phosphatidylethanolamine-binding protein (PEBP) family uncharacterized protein